MIKQIERDLDCGWAIQIGDKVLNKKSLQEASVNDFVNENLAFDHDHMSPAEIERTKHRVLSSLHQGIQAEALAAACMLFNPGYVGVEKFERIGGVEIREPAPSRDEYVEKVLEGKNPANHAGWNFTILSQPVECVVTPKVDSKGHTVPNAYMVSIPYNIGITDPVTKQVIAFTLKTLVDISTGYISIDVAKQPKILKGVSI